jgi:hypothetical protein
VDNPWGVPRTYAATAYGEGCYNEPGDFKAPPRHHRADPGGRCALALAEFCPHLKGKGAPLIRDSVALSLQK